MESKTPLTDALYGNRMVEINADAVFDFAVEARDHARRLESALAVAEEALLSASGSLQLVYAYGAAAQARAALAQIAELRK